MSKRIVYKIIGILYLTVLYVPKDLIIDRDATQWLMLSLINLFVLSINLFLYLKGRIKPFVTPISFKILTGLFIWASLSIIYTLSIQATIVDLSRFLIYLTTFYNLLVLFKELQLSIKHLSIVFTILFIYEIYFPLKVILEILQNISFDNDLANLLQGKASNKNITSFSIALKIPFLIYLYFKSEKKIIKIGVLGLISLAYVMLNFLDTRAITLANYLILILLIFNLVLNFKKSNFILTSILILAITLSFNIPSLLNDKRTDKNIELVKISSDRDESSNQRLRFYKAGISQIVKNPIIGVGFGNWKLESIKYDKNSVKEYIVPYHMHNDFLQFGAELGIIGMFTYLAFFISTIFYYLKNVLLSQKLKLNIFTTITLVFFIYFFIDSNLNFPFARPMIFLQFLIFLSFLENEIQIKKT